MGCLSVKHCSIFNASFTILDSQQAVWKRCGSVASCQLMRAQVLHAYWMNGGLGIRGVSIG